MKGTKKLEKKIAHSNKGITLIALVITIIVLLILAGIAINLTVGQRGILNQAQNAGKTYKEAEIRENVELALLDLRTEVIFSNQDLTVEYALEKLQEKGVFEEIDKDQQTGISGGYVITLGYDENGNVIIVDIQPDRVARIIAKIVTKGYTRGPVEVSVSVKTKGESVSSLNIPTGWTKKSEGVYEVASNGTYKIQAVLGNGMTVEKEVNITTIDNLPPKAFTITAQQVEAKLVITANAEDDDATSASASSGIDKYEYYVKKASDTAYPEKPYTTNEIEGLAYGTYNVYVKAYDKARNNTDSNEVSVEMINTKMLKYGQKVNYSANGVDDWKIFYINEERNETFIITSDYLLSTKIPTSETGMYIYKSYGVSWQVTPSYVEITQDVRDRFMMSWNVNTTNTNIKCVSRLLDTSAWSGFVTEELKTKGVNAIGSPTLEMFMASWNEVYPDNQITYYSGVSSGGFQLQQNVAYDIGLSVGKDNSLYLPHLEMVDGCRGFYLSSPIVVSTGELNNLVFVRGDKQHLTRLGI